MPWRARPDPAGHAGRCRRRRPRRWGADQPRQDPARRDRRPLAEVAPGATWSSPRSPGRRAALLGLDRLGASGGQAGTARRAAADRTRDVSAGASGHQMRREIAEQPARWQDVLATGGEQLRAGRARIRASAAAGALRRPGYQRPAALYGNYLVQTALGVPRRRRPRASSRCTTRLGPARRPGRGGEPVGGRRTWSPSSRWPATGGAATLTLTNDAGSCWPRLATRSIDVRAGQETAVAATKSYTGESWRSPHCSPTTLSACSDAAGAGRGGPPPRRRGRELRPLPLRRPRSMTAAAALLGIGARGGAEAGRDLLVSAHGLSSADLFTGRWLLDQSVPLLCFTSEGPDATRCRTGRARRPRVCRRGDRRRHGDRPDAAGRSCRGLSPSSGRCSRSCRPLLAADVAVAAARPDAPRGLTKVTRTY